MSLVATSAEPEGEKPRLQRTPSSDIYALQLSEKAKLIDLFGKLQKQLLLTKQCKEGELSAAMEDPETGMKWLNDNYQNVLGFMCVAEHHGVNFSAEALSALKDMIAR